jgi:cysteine sulfinate desulfinase/cysteine desulfurase-like protein
MTDSRVYTSIRFGIGRYNTETEIDVAVEAIADAVREARNRAAASGG